MTRRNDKSRVAPTREHNKTFSAYPESDTESESEESEDKESENTGNQSLSAPDPPTQAQQLFPNHNDDREDASYAGRFTH